MSRNSKPRKRTHGVKTYGVMYRQTRIPLQKNPRKGICSGCGRSIRKQEIKTTQIHHWLYKYLTDTVKANPLLVLENTNEFCFYPCHKAGDALRVLTADITPKYYETIVDVAKLMPRKQRERLIRLCEMLIEAEVDKNGTM